MIGFAAERLLDPGGRHHHRRRLWRKEPAADGAAEYIAAEGDLIDQIRLNYYGSHLMTAQVIYDQHFSMRLSRTCKIDLMWGESEVQQVGGDLLGMSGVSWKDG
jgi:hypothetical protein